MDQLTWSLDLAIKSLQEVIRIVSLKKKKLDMKMRDWIFELESEWWGKGLL